jgi:hypothetical protein
VSFGTPPPDVTDDVELSSEQEAGGELRRRLVLPSAVGKERRRLLRLDLLPPLFRFLLEPCKYEVQNFIVQVFMKNDDQDLNSMFYSLKSNKH